MSIKSIIESPGQPKRSYATGHVFKCFKCNLWVRHLRDNEICEHCNKQAGIKEQIRVLNTQQAISADGEA